MQRPSNFFTTYKTSIDCRQRLLEDGVDVTAPPSKEGGQRNGGYPLISVTQDVAAALDMVSVLIAKSCPMT